MNTKLQTAIAVAVVIFSLCSIPARGGSLQDQAVTHFNLGRNAYLANNYDVAINEFTTSFNQVNHPVTAYFLAVTFMAKDDRPSALNWAQRSETKMSPYLLDDVNRQGADSISAWASAPPQKSSGNNTGLGVVASALSGRPTIPELLNLRDSGRCNAYASIAIAQQRINLSNHCNLSDGRWNTDARYHYQWCMSQAASTTQSETASRQGALNQCAAGVGVAKKCSVYAATAVEQQAINSAQRCGFSGGRWNSDYAYHYQWCVSQSANSTDGEYDARRQLLDSCLP
jgi:hypothetical protein